jgi:tetraacyldisaccharide 4'-kinase
LRFLLFPFAILFDAITSVRNQLYELGFKPSARFDLPLISVGNLAVGGTGKSPMIEHLIRLLKDRFRIATLSRGYGRATKGFRLANQSDNASTLGDEPFQFFKKFETQVCVAVGEERAMAIPNLLDLCPDIQVILLDDAYQHRRVAPSFQILLTDYNKPFYRDFLLPVGSLRESRHGAERADVIVVTKCPPELSEDEMMEIETEIRKNSNKPIFFTTVRYGNIISFGSAVLNGLPERIVLVSGIASAKPMASFISSGYKIVRHFDFPDHHTYSTRDLQEITEVARAQNAAIITTEKDFVKLDVAEFHIFLSQAPFFYLPIEIEFLKNGKDFDEMLLNVVKNA